MCQNLLGDSLFCDSNVVPRDHPSGISHPPPTTSLVKPLELEVSNSISLTEFQALQVEEILYSSSPADETGLVNNTASADSISHGEKKQAFPFLSLPYEIRLQIYKWVHLTHPVKQLQLTPWLPTPVYDAYVVKTVRPGPATRSQAHSGPTERPTTQEEEETEKGKESPGTIVHHPGTEAQNTAPRLLSPHRPLAGMPSSLLRANQQIYLEARALPFLENEFVFINWFASGLWAARAFLRTLAPWQRGAMRYARLELLARDLAGGAAAHGADWGELGGLWSDGLRGLRLKVVSGAGPFGHWNAQDATSKAVRTGLGVDFSAVVMRDWVGAGLGSMRRLRFIEVELLGAEWDDETRVGWCECLQAALNESRARSAWVRVVCVERASGVPVGRML